MRFSALKPNALPAMAVALIAALLLGLPVTAAAAPASKLADPDDKSLSGGERLDALMERVRQAQDGIETLEADFVQRQESAMLLEPEVSEGRFSYVAPESVRWEYATPKPISVVIDGEEMTTWYRDLERAERLKVGRYSNQVLKYLGASGSMDALMEYFSVRVRFPEADAADQPYRIELIPRYERVAKRLKSMTVWVDHERYLPVRMRYVAADGDVTEYEFRDMKLNAKIPAERFELQMPASVKVREITLDRS